MAIWNGGVKLYLDSSLSAEGADGRSHKLQGNIVSLIRNKQYMFMFIDVREQWAPQVANNSRTQHHPSVTPHIPLCIYLSPPSLYPTNNASHSCSSHPCCIHLGSLTRALSSCLVSLHPSLRPLLPASTSSSRCTLVPLPVSVVILFQKTMHLRLPSQQASNLHMLACVIVRCIPTEKG